METINLSTFFNALNRKLEPPVKQHLKNVYGCMSMAIIMASFGCYLHSFTNLLSGGLFSSLASFGFCFVLASTPDNNKNHNTRLAYLMGLSLCAGLSLGPLIDLALIINPSIILTALVSTCVIFACFSLATIFSEHRKWLYLYGTLSSLLSLLVLFSFCNIFFGSTFLFQTNIYLGLFVMCGFIIYDTALIIEKCRMGETDYIWHTVLLFLDFLNVFKHILVILMQKEGKKKKK